MYWTLNIDQAAGHNPEPHWIHSWDPAETQQGRSMKVGLPHTRRQFEARGGKDTMLAPISPTTQSDTLS